MSGENFFSGMFQPVVLNTDGSIAVAAGYKAKFYDADTDIAKTIYTDPSLLVPYASPSNTAFLDDTGKALIYLGVGGYKLVLTDPNDVPVPGYTIDNIVGNGAFGTGFVNSFADLAEVNTNIFPYTYIGGYYTPGDGGEGMFYNETSTDSPDGGYIQESTFDPSKRWFRIPDENGKVRSASFGAIGLGADRTDNMLAADAYAASISATLLINVDVIFDTMTFSSPVVEYVDGVSITPAGTTIVTFTGLVVAPLNRIFNSLGSGLTVNFSGNQVSNPIWFGASPSETPANNAIAFSAWLSANAGVFWVPPGEYQHNGVFTPSDTIPTKFDGTILLGVGPNVQYAPGLNYPNEDSRIRTAVIAFLNNALLTSDGLNGIQTADKFTADGDIDTHGNFNADGDANISATVNATDVEATNNIHAQNDSTAAGKMTAGTYMSPVAGGSGTRFKAAGARQVVVGTGDGALDFTSLDADNAYIKVIFSGTTTSTSPTITVTVGAQTVFSSSALFAPSGGTFKYHGEVILIRTGTTSSFSSGFVSWNASGAGAINSDADSRTATIDWSITNDIVQSASSGTNNLTMYEIYPEAPGIS